MSEKMVEIPEELIEDIHYHLNRYDSTDSRVNAGYHLSELFNKVGDLTSWHSGYDINSGTMPWERQDD